MPAKTRPTECCTTAEPPVALTASREEQVVQVLRALADPTRLRIVRLLAAQHAPLCACDVIDHVGLSQPTVSHHMKALTQSGLVIATRQGVWMYYALDRTGIAAVQEVLGRLGAPAITSPLPRVASARTRSV